MDEVDEPSVSFLRFRKPGGLKSSKDLSDRVPLIAEDPKHASRELLKDVDKYHDGSTPSTKDSQACAYGRRIFDDCSSRVPPAGYLRVLSWLNEGAKSICLSFKGITPRPVELEGAVMVMPLLQNFEKLLDRQLEILKLAMDRDSFGLAWITSALNSLIELYFAFHWLLRNLELPNSSRNRDYVFPVLRYRDLLYPAYQSIGGRISLIRDRIRLPNVDLDVLKDDILRKRGCSVDLRYWERTFNMDLNIMNKELFGIIVDELVDLPLVGKGVPLEAKICVLMGAMFGLKMMTFLVTGALFAAFGPPEWVSSNYGKLEKLLRIQILQPELYGWSQLFADIQKRLTEEIDKLVCCGAFGLKEVREISLIMDKDILPMLERKVDVEGNMDSFLAARRLSEDLYKDLGGCIEVHEIFLAHLRGRWIDW